VVTISLVVACDNLHPFRQFGFSTGQTLDFSSVRPEASAPKIDFTVGNPAQHNFSKEAF
jgi:hypothetical protein